MKKYTEKELNEIQQKAKEILDYATKNEKNKLPNIFNYLKIIIKNIDICKADNYNSSEELTALIQQDWKVCLHPHIGLMEFYFENENFEICCQINEAFQKMIIQLDKIISHR